MTADQAADILIRLEAGWPGETWRSSTVDLWYGLLIDLDYTDTYEAVTACIKSSEHRPAFAVVRSHVDYLQRRRNAAPVAAPCLRCRQVPAEQGRTRCTACQAVVDGGEPYPAMMQAVAAAHRRNPL